MPSTTNFSWTTPADTDYVKDGASAIRTLANGIDTSMAQLKGGTTGQILSKTNGTDMAFTWITNDVGDITAVTAGTGLSGGGTSGAVTVSIDTATTVDKTTAQTLTNKTLTAPVISTISNTGILTLPTSTDTLVGRATSDTLTNKTISASSNTLTGVINNTLTTTTGDLIYASSANTPARLAIGSTDQILKVSGGVPVWATPSASASGLTLVTTNSFSTVSALNVNTCFTSTYTSYRIILDVDTVSAASADFSMRLRASGSDKTASNYNNAGSYTLYAGTSSSGFYGQSQTSWFGMGTGSGKSPLVIMDIHKPQATAYTLFNALVAQNGSGGLSVMLNGNYNATDSVDGFSAYCSSGTISGTYWVFGYQKS